MSPERSASYPQGIVANHWTRRTSAYLKEINNADRKDAHRLFQCLAVARRPLRIEELAVVLALDVDAGGIPKFNANWRREDHEAAVLSACSSLVSVVNHGGSLGCSILPFLRKEILNVGSPRIHGRHLPVSYFPRFFPRDSCPGLPRRLTQRGRPHLRRQCWGYSSFWICL
jgi:hypothetical protein